MKKNTRTNVNVAAACLVLSAGIFFVDTLFPLGIAGGVPYVAVIVTSFRMTRSRGIFLAAAACTLLTILGYFVSPAGGIHWMVLANRFLAILIIWVTAILGLERRRAYDAARKNEARSRALLNASPDLMFRMDRDGTYLDWGAGKNIPRLASPEEFMGKKIVDTLPPEVAEPALDFLKQALETGETQFFEYELLLEAAVQSFEARFSPIDRDEVLMTVRDITDRKRSIEALRKSEARLSEAQRIACMGSWEWDIRQNRSFLSEELRRILGWSSQKEESTYEEFLDSVHPEDRESIKQAVADALEGRKKYDIDHRFIRPDGSVCFLNSQANVDFDEEGRPIRMKGTATDITERKRADEALRFTQFAIDHASDAAYWFTPEGRIFYVNQATCRALGYSREDLLKMSIPDFHPNFPAEKWLETWKRVEEAGSLTLETLHRRKDGTTFPAEIQAQILQFEGKQFGFAFGRDITARKQAEQALRRQAQIIDQIHDSVVSMDLDGLVTSWNLGAERIFGYQAEEMLGKHISRIYPPEDHLFLQEQVIAPLKKNGEHEVEVRMRKKSGEDFYAHLSLSLLSDDDGTVTGMIGYTLDITERKRVEEALEHQTRELAEQAQELKRSNSELEQFAYVASHDLQEPLRMVSSFTQLLRKRYGGELDKDADDYIGYAVDGVSRMQTLIQDLLAYSRVTSKGGSPEPTEATAALDRALHNLRGSIRHSKAHISWDPLPSVLADPTQLTQLLQNLVGNGLKFRNQTPPQVHISAQANGDEWVFSVRDNGIGIDPKYSQRIFTIFQRLHTRSEYPGTGIGLSICRKIVERHGGRIWVESEPGKGATFQFTLSACALDGARPAPNLQRKARPRPATTSANRTEKASGPQEAVPPVPVRSKELSK